MLNVTDCSFTRVEAVIPIVTCWSCLTGFKCLFCLWTAIKVSHFCTVIEYHKNYSGAQIRFKTGLVRIVATAACQAVFYVAFGKPLGGLLVFDRELQCWKRFAAVPIMSYSLLCER